MEVTPAQEAAYLEHWRQRRLAEERRRGEYEEMLEREAEEEARQAAAAQAAAHPPRPGTACAGTARHDGALEHGVRQGRAGADAHRPHGPRGRRRRIEQRAGA